jgi:hypothetical protein
VLGRRCVFLHSSFLLFPSFPLRTIAVPAGTHVNPNWEEAERARKRERDTNEAPRRLARSRNWKRTSKS